MKTITGDLIALALLGQFDVIVHGCNCFNTMGAGIARQIVANFPAAYHADQQTEPGDKAKLGSCTVATCETPEGEVVHVVNAYTQYFYGRRRRNVDYEAIQSCMKWVKQYYGGKRIGLPMIGAGLGGGDWDVISKIIDTELADEDVTLVVLEG